jgi:hypothetical protein
MVITNFLKMASDNLALNSSFFVFLQPKFC